MQTTDAGVLRGITGIVESADGDLWVHGIAGAVLIRAAIRSSPPQSSIGFCNPGCDDVLRKVA